MENIQQANQQRQLVSTPLALIPLATLFQKEANFLGCCDCCECWCCFSFSSFFSCCSISPLPPLPPPLSSLPHSNSSSLSTSISTASVAMVVVEVIVVEVIVSFAAVPVGFPNRTLSVTPNLCTLNPHANVLICVMPGELGRCEVLSNFFFICRRSEESPSRTPTTPTPPTNQGLE